MGSFKEKFEKYLAEKETQRKALETSAKQKEAYETTLKRNWFIWVDHIEKRANEVIVPLLRVIGKEFNEAPYIKRPSTEEQASYKKIKGGIGRYPPSFVGGVDYAFPHVDVYLTLERGSMSGTDCGWNTKTYHPGKELRATCFEKDSCIFVDVVREEPEPRIIKGRAGITEQKEIEKLLLEVIKDLTS